TLLMLVQPDGPTCHLGTQSCFGDEGIASLSDLADLAATIHMRRLLPEAQSYTAKLFEDGVTRIAQKVGEEGVETALAAATKSPTLTNEAADLIYHLLVLLEACETDWMDVIKVLHERAQAKKKK
ncbi:MAG TPA: phosphoribosyl-ATP diphosphatase, partial [Alphaproteobacteria bacterium]|nr:phosphoribosyl-ATP diphosphatase [Alphaproteobacteria bacterium]